ncbi:hypothetical protein [Sphaerisporangium sp. NPDC051011]|uniref:hypothetical protein n=1 Tax=Sphaerisporangium sp. NPDC051011 TaxID=3155792 RepID=UPI003409AA0E
MSSKLARRALWRLALKRIAANQADRLALEVVLAGVLWSPAGSVAPGISMIDLRKSMEEDIAARCAVRDLEYYMASGRGRGCARSIRG